MPEHRVIIADHSYSYREICDWWVAEDLLRYPKDVDILEPTPLVEMILYRVPNVIRLYVQDHWYFESPDVEINEIHVLSNGSNLKALQMFCAGIVPFGGSMYFPELKGKYISELPRMYRDRIRKYQILVVTVDFRNSPEVKKHLAEKFKNL